MPKKGKPWWLRSDYSSRVWIVTFASVPIGQFLARWLISQGLPGLVVYPLVLALALSIILALMWKEHKRKLLRDRGAK